MYSVSKFRMAILRGVTHFRVSITLVPISYVTHKNAFIILFMNCNRDSNKCIKQCGIKQHRDENMITKAAWSQGLHKLLIDGTDMHAKSKSNILNATSRPTAVDNQFLDGWRTLLMVEHLEEHVCECGKEPVPQVYHRPRWHTVTGQ